MSCICGCDLKEVVGTVHLTDITILNAPYLICPNCKLTYYDLKSKIIEITKLAKKIRLQKSKLQKDAQKNREVNMFKTKKPLKILDVTAEVKDLGSEEETVTVKVMTLDVFKKRDELGQKITQLIEEYLGKDE